MTSDEAIAVTMRYESGPIRVSDLRRVACARRRFAFCVALLAVGIWLPSHGAAAGVISIAGNKGDGMVYVTGEVVNLHDPTIRPGNGGNLVEGQAGIFFFPLPIVQSPSAITAADLQFGYLGIAQFTITTIPDFNIDLFGLGARSTATILSSDYYDGNASFSTNTLITRDLITPSTPVGTLDVANAILLNFIQSLYLPNGRPTASFAVFRANPDIHLPVHSDPYRGYVMATADNPDRSLIPRLTLGVATVPEPSTLVAWGFGMLLVGWRFRRART